jgi:co-chaperonin GroES (HSP10)
MKIKPAGFYVLLEMDNVESVSEGGIILNTKEVAREQDACQFGIVRAFGPAAYKGFPGCDGPNDWGVTVGDRVEYRRYEGMRSNHEEAENMRYIPDSHIIGVISEA